MTDFPLHSLGKILTLERRPVRVETDALYAEIGIYSFGRGIFHKHPRTGFEVGNKKLFLIREGDFILHVTFSWEGAIGLASEAEDGMYGSTRFPTFRADEDLCSVPYLYNYFRTEAGRRQLARISHGSAGRNRVLSMKRIPEVMVPLPPLDEQHRIVARIEDLVTLVEELQELRVRARQEVDAMLASSIGALCRQYESNLQPLAEVLAIKPSNGWSPKCDNHPNGTPVLTLSAVTGFHYDGKQIKTTSQPVQEGARYWLQKGDLLITRSNTPELVGHAAIYDGTPEKCIYPDLMMRTRVKENVADLKFVHYWLMSPLVREFIRNRARGTSPTMKKIAQGDVMEIPFPEGASIGEQRRIVAYLDGLQVQVDELAALQEATQADLDALLPSVLDWAFRGEL